MNRTIKFVPLQIAVHALRRNKVRTLLTVLGIVIGIMAVITVMSAGKGLEAFVVEQIETFGTDVIQVEVKVPNTGKTSTANAIGIAQGIQITTLTLADAEALKKIPNIKDNYASVLGQEIVSFSGEKKQIMLWGASASFIDIDASTVSVGRFFSDDEDKSLVNVAVLGNTVKEELFGDEEALGQLIKVGRQKFKVIGVMAPRGSIAFFDLDNFIYVPVRTIQKKLMGIDHVVAITNQVYSQELADQTAAEITALLRERHDLASNNPDKDDFSVTTMAEALEIYATIFGAISLLLSAIAGISLVVGGVGIMNIMYVSVAERTYEIGLRKSVGAAKNNILWQFLWEAIVITFLGAILGFVLGVVLSLLLSLVATGLGFGWPLVISPSSIILAIGVSLAIGLGFGVFPALAAARLDPVTALRSGK